MATHENKRNISDFFERVEQAKRVKTTENERVDSEIINELSGLKTLIEMGFDKQQAETGLIQNDNNLARATEWCINNSMQPPFTKNETVQKEEILISPPLPKRTLQASLSRFQAPIEVELDKIEVTTSYTKHVAYPFPILNLPQALRTAIFESPTKAGKLINDHPDLDLVYYEPYFARNTADALFQFLRSNLPFYRVEYDIKRGNFSTHIKTPRYTTVFGLDSTSFFDPNTGTLLTSSIPHKTIDRAKDKHYSKYAPRPLPQCLDDLRLCTEAATGETYNFCLVNYYASGADSISYHSDDERFLGDEPAISSFTLGARRDFLMKHKPPAPAKTSSSSPIKGGKPLISSSAPLKLPLASGDMILMRGRTQSNWLHSIPKRSGPGSAGGRINLTFRKALVRAGTENYYNYNVGAGPIYGWDEKVQEMTILKPEELEARRAKG